jgi:glycosyltransferase involved in cell wall biosynthesis
VRRFPVLRDGSGYVRGYLPYLSFDIPLLVRLLAARRPGVIVVEPPPTTGVVVRAVAALRRVPYVWYAADVWSDATAMTGSPRFVVAVVRALERWVLRGARLVLSVSDGVTERVRELGAREVVTVGNGIDTEVFGLVGSSLADHRTLVYAGTASEWQGADVFARAMRQVLVQVPDARLVYLGQGSAWAQISEVAESLPDGAVTMLGSVPAERSAAWLRGAAAAVVSIVPGQGYDFAIPTKLFAALGTGTPVVYAGVGPVVDLVDQDRLGWAVAHDVDAVAAAMVAALQAPDDEQERRRRAAWVLENRSLRAAAERAADAIVDVSGRRSSA